MTYQRIAGTLSPGGHPGSYNGQDAYNDMLVTNENVDQTTDRRIQGTGCSLDDYAEGLQIGNRPHRGGGELSAVRRLTVTECERLQGFEDGWTDIGDWTDSSGKLHKAADSPRYRALGNSIALPFWKFLARRICAQYERDMTMGSLFDGIGGFVLAFESAGAKALLASEIDEFCIAVTKKHFGEG